MRKIIALGITNVFLLTGCQTTTPTAPEPDLYFTARGNEPGWIVRFDAKKIAFEGDYGETKITVPKPQGRPSFNGMRYITDQLTVDVTHASCADVMSGQRYAETVTVLASGKEYRGCGGRQLPPESLNDTDWTVVIIEQMPILPNVPTSLRFTGGRVSGNAGCNNFTGSYTVIGGTINFDAIAATKMACGQKEMMQEAKLLSVLKSKVSMRYTVNGDLILTNESGQRATFRRVI